MAASQALFTEEQVRQRARARGEPAWLVEDRLTALKRFTALPLESSPLFTRHTEAPKDLALAEGAKPKLSAAPRGVTLRELEADPQAQAALTNDLPGFEHDKFTNLPRALFTTGAALHVAKDAHVEQPLTVRYDSPGMARNLVVLEPGARATVVVEAAHPQGLLGMTCEALVGDGAELRLLGVETAGSPASTVLSTQARTGDDAVLEVHHAFTGGTLVKGRNDIVLRGRGSRVRQSEVVFGARQQRFDLTSFITHAGPDTTSDALSKAVLRDAARANIKGVIILPKEGKGSDSYLQQHAMLMSKQARCIAIPSLEIVNREIKRAKHAATVAQVDEAQIFYLQTRGLSEEEARKAIVLGFLGPLLERLGEAAAERVRAEIEAKWQSPAEGAP